MVVNLHRLDINAFFLSVHYILYYNKHWRIPACESSRTRTQFNIFCQYCNLPYSFLVDPTAISIFALLDVTDIFHETLQESVAACGFFVSSPLDTLTLVADIASTQLHSTGCCKTTGKLWQHVTETLYGVFLLFLCSFDCQIWAIFHFGTLWLWKWTYFLKI